MEIWPTGQSLSPQNMCSPAQEPRYQKECGTKGSRRPTRVSNKGTPCPLLDAECFGKERGLRRAITPLGTPARGLPGAPTPASTDLALGQSSASPSPQLIHLGLLMCMGAVSSLFPRGPGPLPPGPGNLRPRPSRGPHGGYVCPPLSVRPRVGPCEPRPPLAAL